MYPDFLIAGFHRCGTTSLSFMLEQHPKINIPTGGHATGEIHFFDNRFDKRLDWYLKLFKGKNKVQGDKSPSYVTNQLAILRIKRTLPSIKIILVLRDPAERWFSHYKQWNATHKNQLSLQEFYEIHPEALERGYYAKHLSSLFQLFSKNQIYLIWSKSLRKDTFNTMKKVFAFLELDIPKIKLRDKRRTFLNEYPVEWVAKIEREYEEKNEELRRFLQLHNLDNSGMAEW